MMSDVWLWCACLCVLEQLGPVAELRPLILWSWSCSWSSSWADGLRPGDGSSVVSVSSNSNRRTTCDCFGTWWKREFLVQHWFKIFLHPQTKFPRRLWETLDSSVFHLTSIHHRNTPEGTKQLIKVINDKWNLCGALCQVTPIIKQRLQSVTFFSSNLLFLPGAPGSLFAVGRVDDFKALQQQILQGGALLREMVVALFALNAQEELNLHKVRQAGRETSTDQKKQSWYIFFRFLT